MNNDWDWKTWMIGKNSMKIARKFFFSSHLNMNDVTDADYTQAQRVCKDSKTTNLGEYHDLYVQSNT